MNTRKSILSIRAAVLVLLVPAASQADEVESTNLNTNLNHFRLSARVGFNITAQFKTLGTFAPIGRTTPNGDQYNYDNGYVFTDVSGVVGGPTWYWGYDTAAQISGNTILMSRSTPLANTASPTGVESGDPNFGFEVNYNRQLGQSGKWRYGLEAAFNYTKVSFDDHVTFAGNVSQSTDAYPFTPGTTPPQNLPYQGTFNGPGFLIGSTRVSSTTSVVGGGTFTGQQKFDSDIWGLRLGPYVEYQLSERLDLAFSAGLATGLLVNSASWNESISVGGNQVAVSTGNGSNTAVVWGGYAAANLAWHFSEHWSAEGGVQFQSLGKYEHDLGGRTIALDLSKSLFATVSVGYSF